MLLINHLIQISIMRLCKNANKKKTDKILTEDLGGLSEAMQERLVELYLAPMEELGGDDNPKNPNMTVVM